MIPGAREVSLPLDLPVVLSDSLLQLDTDPFASLEISGTYESTGRRKPFRSASHFLADHWAVPYSRRHASADAWDRQI